MIQQYVKTSLRAYIIGITPRHAPAPCPRGIHGVRSMPACASNTATRTPSQ